VDWDQEVSGRHAKKGTLIYNYEDCDFRELESRTADAQEDEWLGKGPREDLLIVRDPFNLIASRLRWARGKKWTPSLDQFPLFRELWKAYAREFLRETRYLKNPICVSYNHWFCSRKYRDELGGRLGFQNRDRGLEEVAKWGPTIWGDSFDELKLDGMAQRMKVLERWKDYVDDEFFRAQFTDPELLELSERIFGPLPGTDRLLT
jgi:hypothetical protein